MDEEEDFVVKEIPVYLSKQLTDQLYIFQYPLRPSDQKSDKTFIKTSAIKPNNQEVKLEMGLKINSVNFDMSKAEEIAINADGPSGFRDNDSNTLFENNFMDKQCLISSKSIEVCNKYAIGTIHAGEVHITPLKGILQLRPSFPYLDKSDKRIKESEKTEIDEEIAEPEQAKQITVKFARTENERMKKAREKSFNYLCQKSAEEPWCSTKYHQSNSDVAELEKIKLLSEGQESVGDALNVKGKDYLRMLIPPDQEEAAVIPQAPSHVLSLNALKMLPLLEQCRLLLKDAKIITFQQLMILLTGGEPLNPETVLRTLPQVASLCRGNWVVRSDILYPKDTFSAVSGVPANIMCRARDYVLYLFTQNQYVERRKVSSVIKLPAEEVKEIFTGVSRLRTNKGWELLLPTDNNFIEKYPDVVQRQQLFWEAKQKQFNEFLKDNNKIPNRQRRKSKSVSDEVKQHQNGIKRDCIEINDNANINDNTNKNKKSPVSVKKLKFRNGENTLNNVKPVLEA